MVDPALVPGEHDTFVCGNDAAAKATVTALLRDFGWKHVIDLGDITRRAAPRWSSPCGCASTRSPAPRASTSTSRAEARTGSCSLGTMRSLLCLGIIVLAGCGARATSAGGATGHRDAETPRASTSSGWRAVPGTGVRFRGLDQMTATVGAVPGLADDATGARLVVLEASTGFSRAFVDGMLDGIPGWVPASREDALIDGRGASVLRRTG